MKNYILVLLILSHISFCSTQKSTINNKSRRNISQLNHIYQKRKDQLTYFISKSFGNTLGAINFQRFFKSISTNELKRLKNKVLEPGDLILKKSNGAFSGKLIPGHFNHLGLYLGTYEQLKSLKLSNGENLIDQTLVKKYLPYINLGKTIIDPVRSGVTLSNLENWKVNDLAIIRLKNYSKSKMSDALLKAINYLGTKYDFNFDLDTKNIIFCSELPYQIFKDVEYKISKNLVRWTINPDDIAELAGKRNNKKKPFQLIYFNHNTLLIDLEVNFNLYTKLLNIRPTDQK